MKSRCLAGAFCIGLILAVPDGAAAQCSPESLVGTWRMVSASYDGKAYTIEDTHLKLITPTHFTWVVFNKAGKVLDGGGGTFLASGSSYRETAAFRVTENIPIAQELLFSCGLEGNRWTHKGEIPGVVRLEEAWEKVTKEPPEPKK
jgi:hypothetical protein